MYHRPPTIRTPLFPSTSPDVARDEDRRITEVVAREQSRLRNFIRRRVADPRDAEDILQDVFARLVEANRLLMPIDHVTGWLFRVARNRITDLFRKKEPERFSDVLIAEDEEGSALEDLLPSPDGRTRRIVRPSRTSRRSRACAERTAAGTTRNIYRARAGRKKLQRARRCNRFKREHVAVTQTLRSAASARTAAQHLRRIYAHLR